MLVLTFTNWFLSRNVLERTAGIEDIGEMRWPLFGCLVLAWIVVFLCLCKGVKSSGKVRFFFLNLLLHAFRHFLRMNKLGVPNTSMKQCRLNSFMFNLISIDIFWVLAQRG